MAASRLVWFRGVSVGAVVALGAALVPVATSQLNVHAAGSPDPVVVSDSAPGPATWTSDSFPGGANVGNVNGDNCFDSTGHPNPYTPTGPNACEVFTLTVNLSVSTFWSTHSGGVKFHSDEGANDFDFYVYRKNADGTKGALITAQGAIGSTGGIEEFTIDKAQGDYYVAAAAFATLTFTQGTFTFFLGPSIPNTPPIVTNPPGVPQFRASNDIFTSHSEPHIAMNPLNHANLVAGSKQYVNNKHYLFRIGMYSSFDGGQTWNDAGHLPVPTCPATTLCSPPPDTTPSACAGNGPFSDACKFTTSDIWTTFDDEGNAYGIVLVSPSSNVGTGWEMWMYRSTDGGRTWPLSNMRVIHNHNDHTLSNFFLDDKDAIAVDNYTLAGTGLTTGPNNPRDGHIGNLYACWGLDGTVVPTQNQVFSRSLDGGNTWSQALIISGATNAREIGCQIAVAPSGRVYVSFFVYALTSPAGAPYVTGVGQYLTWSDDHGATFGTPIKVAAVNPVPNHLQTADNFRNLSLPAMAVSPRDGTVYITWADEHTSGSVSDADILLVKGADRGLGLPPDFGTPLPNPPVRVNQDPIGNGKDQFQPQIAVTALGQVDISYFDRRSDPNDFFIDTYLSRSNDGGATWTDTRVTSAMSDPRINPPIDGAGNFFYGDYQGLVADDSCATPFWQDTHLANLAVTDPNYSPWQEVFSARLPNGVNHCTSGEGACHEADGDGQVNRTDASGTHRATFHFDKDACEDSDAESVSEQDPDGHTSFQSTQILSVAFDDVLHIVTLTGTGTDNGLPVTFTMVGSDSTVVPGSFSLTLSDGYSISGPLSSGAIQL